MDSVEHDNVGLEDLVPLQLQLMSHSSDSTLSANSSLIDCRNFASDYKSVESATCKRKRDCEGGTPLPLAMKRKLIFFHIMMARLDEPPFHGLAWNDELLWSKIAESTNSTLPEVVRCVIQYGELYGRDKTLPSLTDEVFKNLVLTAFKSNFAENPKGCVGLQDLCNVAKAVEANQPLPKPDVRPGLQYSALQNEIRYKISKEFGYRGALAVQYGEDLLSLNLNSAEKCNLLQRHGPLSAEYVAIAEKTKEERLKLLRLLNDSPTGSISLRLTLLKIGNEQFL